ncbi:MAG: hypothetical protein UR28_C0001G0099 [Candidatus Peregrinibacteria bacterium GW2011_GWF2_33_10]|nr:MAG: hypothetical protein UR28_C0001G0099 [Candidatus Peregrinibacteria bacterium GW2011_GWF2_33_10]
MTQPKSPGCIRFFCRNCAKIIENPEQKKDTYVYLCPDCKEDQVTFGTEKSIKHFFHLK